MAEKNTGGRYSYNNALDNQEINKQEPRDDSRLKADFHSAENIA